MDQKNVGSIVVMGSSWGHYLEYKKVGHQCVLYYNSTMVDDSNKYLSVGLAKGVPGISLHPIFLNKIKHLQ